MNIRNSVVLITGANRGIGGSLVEASLEGGAARVYAAARRPTDLDPVLTLDPSRVHPIRIDVTKPDEIAAAAQAAKGVNLLINNAGIVNYGSLIDLSPEIVRSTMETNYYGMLQTARAFSPVIEANGGGAIVNILSVVALVSIPRIGAYNASKAAAWSMTQALRADLANRGIQVFAVFPGPVDTEMARDFEMPKTPAKDVAQAILEGIEAGTEDIFPDPMSKQFYADWKADHKAVEHQFALV
jgi:NAD(P)-dependent dehydrogenase (short-subunit alcohol dehydrogenase family)